MENIDDLKKVLIQKYTMPVSILDEVKKPSVKIEKIEDYYNFFVAMLRTEAPLLQNMEHLWILGINESGYSSCAYLVNYGKRVTFDYYPHDLYHTTLHHNCEKIVLCCYRNTHKKIEITKEDVAYANLIYHSAKLLRVELIDYIVISSAHDDLYMNPTPPDYNSLLKLDLMKELAKDISFEPYYKFKEQIDEEMSGYGQKMKEEGQQREKIEIARKMLAKNKSIDEIIEFTDLTAAEIEKIKSEI